MYKRKSDRLYEMACGDMTYLVGNDIDQPEEYEYYQIEAEQYYRGRIQPILKKVFSYKDITKKETILLIKRMRKTLKRSDIDSYDIDILFTIIDELEDVVRSDLLYLIDEIEGEVETRSNSIVDTEDLYF